MKRNNDTMTNVLVNIFAYGFYKLNSGFLMFLFVTLVSYCFFINTVGDIKLLSLSQVLYYNFSILINFVSSPVITVIFFLSWLMLTIKSWYYAAGQLTLAHHQFLYYSCNAFSKYRQFKSWFYVQFIISLPFLVYVIVAIIPAIIFHHYVSIAAIILFTFIVIAISALIFVRLLDSFVREKHSSWLLRFSGQWRKPFFSLFIYHIFEKLKLTFVITKFLSYLVIVSISFTLSDTRSDPRVTALAVLGVVMAHAILVWQQHKFESIYLGIGRNLPYQLNVLYLRYTLCYFLLLLPETLWLFVTFRPQVAAPLFVLLLGLMMVFHCILYQLGFIMRIYLPLIFSLFLLTWMLILFGLMPLLIPVSVLASLIMFRHNYYKASYLNKD